MSTTIISDDRNTVTGDKFRNLCISWCTKFKDPENCTVEEFVNCYQQVGWKAFDMIIRTPIYNSLISKELLRALAYEMQQVAIDETLRTRGHAPANLRDILAWVSLHRGVEPLPPVECKPWCEDGTGHTDEQYVEDQQCSSAGVHVPLSLTPVDDGRDVDLLDVHLVSGQHAGPWIHVFSPETDMHFDVTATEAEALAAALVQQAKLLRDS